MATFVISYSDESSLTIMVLNEKDMESAVDLAKKQGAPPWLIIEEFDTERISLITKTTKYINYGNN